MHSRGQDGGQCMFAGRAASLGTSTVAREEPRTATPSSIPSCKSAAEATERSAQTARNIPAGHNKKNLSAPQRDDPRRTSRPSESRAPRTTQRGDRPARHATLLPSLAAPLPPERPLAAPGALLPLSSGAPASGDSASAGPPGPGHSADSRTGTSTSATSSPSPGSSLRSTAAGHSLARSALRIPSPGTVCFDRGTSSVLDIGAVREIVSSGPREVLTPTWVKSWTGATTPVQGAFVGHGRARLVQAPWIRLHHRSRLPSKGMGVGHFSRADPWRSSRASKARG
jgi:hypothetical protein